MSRQSMLSRGNGSQTARASTSRLNTPARREKELLILKEAVLGSLKETERALRVEELAQLRDQVLGTLGEIDQELGEA